MRDDEEDDTRLYSVVKNHEEQYSIWLADRDPPSGWTKTGTDGTKEQCLENIKLVWTDMRPLSLRKKIEEWERELAAQPPEVEDESAADEGGVDDLVRRLTEAQPVEAALRPTRTLDELRAACARGYVHIKFTKTGTELGVRLNRQDSDLAALDGAGDGTIRLSGELALNYNQVRLRCTLDLATLAGTGSLEFIAALAPGEPWAPTAGENRATERAQ
jgi:MbtH protein